MLFFSLHALNRSLYLASETVDNKEDIAAIDKKISDLEEMKRGYAGKVKYHINQAQRYQFIQDEQDIARRHLSLAKANQDVVDKIQKQIDELKAKKEQLLKAA
ncbi:MAG: hypothetical protein HZB76_04460 [Chlamydiae bacterium]|nr:hypothetical protein [Chlamydiota bacterium]